MTKFGSTTMGSPSNEDAKIHTFYSCKLDISQFQDTQENMKETLTKSLWHQNGDLQNSNFSTIQARHMKLSE